MKQGIGRAGRTFSGEVALRTSRQSEVVEITADVEKAVAASGIADGVCYLFVPHTTAGVIVNENDDPAVARDIEATLDRLVPRGSGYEHLEGNADAHVKSALTGVSAMLLLDRGKLALGRWQGIFFCEFDGPRDRRVRVKIVADPSE